MIRSPRTRGGGKYNQVTPAGGLAINVSSRHCHYISISFSLVLAVSPPEIRHKLFYSLMQISTVKLPNFPQLGSNNQHGARLP